MTTTAKEYTGPDRRTGQSARIEVIETRQVVIMGDIDLIKIELRANTQVTNRVMEILEAPAMFWAWCSRWGKRISLFAKVAVPVVALLIAVDQFLHIDLGNAIKRMFTR